MSWLQDGELFLTLSLSVLSWNFLLQVCLFVCLSACSHFVYLSVCLSSVWLFVCLILSNTIAVRDTEWNLASCSIDLNNKDSSKLEEFKSVSHLTYLRFSNFRIFVD